MANEEQKDVSAKHDSGDDELWQELNRRLWLLVKDAEPSKLGEDPSFELPAESLAAAHAVPVRDARKKECLSFVRCRKVADTPASLTSGEKTHLDDCGYCTRRINAFTRELLAVETVATPATKPGPTLPPVQDVRTGLVEQISAFFSRPLIVGLSFAALAVLIGAIGFYIFRSSPELIGTKAPTPESGGTNVNGGAPVLTPPGPENSPVVSVSPDNPPKESPPEPERPKKGGDGSKVPDRPTEERPATVESPSVPVDLRAIPPAIHAFVRAMHDYPGQIPVPPDMSRMFELAAARRIIAGPQPSSPKLLSPNRQVILDDRPTFHWASDEGATFNIIVRNNRKEPVARGQKLTERRWVIPESLPAGIYYWEIYVFNEEGVGIAETQVEAIFKVVDKAEVERVKTENQSHLDKASYFIYVGLLHDAEIELEAELREKPRSRKARKLIQQVRRWQRQLR